jgi:SAM-dependent methyltransferase
MDPALYHEMSTIQEKHWWYRARRKILSDIIADLQLPETPRILEAGCGPGGNLAMLAQFGEVCAIEPYAPACALAKAKYVGQVEQAGLPGALPFAGTFDLICAFDVIEHIEQDKEALISLRAALAPSGRLILTVPAYQWMWSAHDVRNHHVRRYTRPQLRRVLEAAGFTVERASHFNSFLFPLIAGVRLAQRSLSKSGSSSETIPANPVNTALEALFASERHLLRHMNLPFGVSILLVARPSS